MRAPRPLLCFLLSLGVGLHLFGCGEDEPLSTAERARQVAAGFHVPDPERVPSDRATNPGTPFGDFVGSQACQRCHEEEHAKWRKSFHSRTFYDATEDTVFGDFSGEVTFNDPAHPVVVEPFQVHNEHTGKPRHFMSIRWRRPEEGGATDPALRDTYGAGELPDLGMGTFEVRWAFGNRRHQPYVARAKDGRHWVLPVFWNDVDKAWRFNGWRPYVRTCGHCHVTGIDVRERPWHAQQPFVPGTPEDNPRWLPPPHQERWADGAVGCENCHGPGRSHIRAVEEVGEALYRQQRAEGLKGPTIWDGRQAKDASMREDACGRCHNFFTEASHTWRPGPEGYERPAHRWPLEKTDTNTGWQFYEDGSHMTPCTVVEVYRGSTMHAAGVTCFDCHDPHGTDHWADLVLPTHNNALCLKCHGEQFPDEAAQSAHSKHPAGGPGNRCVECHMPRHMAFTNGVHVMSARLHSHEFSIPTGNRPDNGPPPSCNVCHDDKDHAWTRETIQRLWGTEGR